MLEKPDIDEKLILVKLDIEYDVQASKITFLPLGYDVNTAVYHVLDEDGTPYFLKLLKSDFNEIAVLVPKFLQKRGVKAIIAPLEGKSRCLWGNVEDYRMILYPFVAGKNGYECSLTRQQWHEFGAALRRIHTAKVPRDLVERIPHETFSPYYRDTVRSFQELVEHVVFADPVAQQQAALMRSRKKDISILAKRGDELADSLQSRPLKMVLCHSDLHAGNLLLDEEGGLYIVDWDNPLYAPREKDLALIGGCPGWNNPREISLFYQGYRNKKRLQVDLEALAYYRCERAITDIAEFCRQLLLNDEGGSNRDQSYRYSSGQFLPGHEVDLALMTGVNRKNFFSDIF